MLKDLLWFLGVVAVLFDVVFFDGNAFVVIVAVVAVVVVNFESVDFFALAAGIDLAAVHLSVVDCFPEVNEILVIVHDAYLI